MAKSYDAIDTVWSWNGDYSFADGDLADTSDDYLKSLMQDIHTVCASALLDWENYPSLGATLDDFLGEPNTPTTASAIHDRLKASLLAANIVNEEDVAIRVVPVHLQKVLIVIGVNVVATQFNRLTVGEKLIVSFVFDTMEQQMFFLDKTPQLIPR